MKAAEALRGTGYEPFATVLVLTDHADLVSRLARRLPRLRIRSAACPYDSEGIGVDAVVIATPYPHRDLADIRVHPRLHSAPVVVVSPTAFQPSRSLPGGVWTVRTPQRIAGVLTAVVHMTQRRREHPLTIEAAPSPEIRSSQAISSIS